MNYQNIINFEMNFDEAIFNPKELNLVKTASLVLFNKSLLKYTYKPLSKTTALIIFLNYSIVKSDIDKFKSLKLDDVKNLIYNNLIDNQTRN